MTSKSGSFLVTDFATGPAVCDNGGAWARTDNDGDSATNSSTASRK